ncbi:DNA alkylation repair protein [Sphaerotilus mobilis]|uniref:3-methyladenine DNA glycosylase AlkC n=1 Tax=Sphaerotilus mobilis TaxID=47994 RepID=A0A4Q7LSQ6_9BURK|nr:DNA alkylation repair protein [Sphaerotilus mobilis]RZS57895.1 3-methyladenine DNA glycosylase AlkC [Sphaerotilus mobilis]
MAEPLKNLLDDASIAAMAQHLSRVCHDFDAETFVRVASVDLDALAFKARAMQLADALQASLPTHFERAADALEAALAPADAGDFDEPAASRTGAQGLAGWPVWAMAEHIARHGQQQPERALSALHAMTQRFTAEFAIRPFIVRHPALVYATLQRWTTDRSAHVRRLVSEGSRPRLPWGLQLKALVADPSPTRPLLEALQDDASAYVRRSVANHLNDIAKDHPERIADWLARHLPDASEARRALLRHASRTLVKQGDLAVLHAWGLGQPLQGHARLRIAPASICLGESVELGLTLISTSPEAQTLLVDYAVHHVKANGSTSPKVFKGWKLDLAPNESRAFVRRHALRPISTRTYHPGWHRVVVQVNGVAVAEAGFELG